MMFSVTLSEENSAPSWNCTPVRACIARSALPCRVRGIDAQHLDGALGVPIEADDGAQQHGFAGSRPADQADNLAAKYVEIEIVVDDVVAELRAHAAQLQHDVAAVAMIDELAAFEELGRRGSRLLLRRLAVRPSHVRQQEDDREYRVEHDHAEDRFDHRRVVSWPTLSALPLDLQALEAADDGDHAPNTGALIMPA